MSKHEFWNTPDGASLLKAMLGRKPMDERDRETLAIGKSLNDAKVIPMDLEPEVELDIGRIQRDIEDTVIRHGFKEIVFRAEYPEDGETPKVTVRFRFNTA